MRKTFAVAALAALFAAPVAMPANAQIYINVGYSQFNLNNGLNPGAATGRVGYDFSPYIAVEGEGSFGVIEDSGVDLSSDFGAFLVGKLPLVPNFHVFGRVGFSATDVEDADDDGFAYGIGGQYNWGKHGLRLDWTRRDYDEDPVDALSLSYAFSF